MISLTSLILEQDQEVEPKGPSSQITYVTTNQVVDLIKKSNGKIFDVFFKKKDGTIRRLNGRRGVTSYLSGGELPYNADQKRLLIIFDIQKKGYRAVNMDTITSLRLEGKKYVVRN